MNQQLTPDKILETMIAFGPAKALMNAVELGMFTELARGPLDLQTLTERLKLNPRGVRDYCDFLVSLHFLDRQVFSTLYLPATPSKMLARKLYHLS